MNEQIYVRGWSVHHWIIKMWPCHRCARIVLRGSVRRGVRSLNWVPCPCCSVSTDMTLLVPSAPVTVGSYWPITHWLIKMFKMVTSVNRSQTDQWSHGHNTAGGAPPDLKLYLGVYQCFARANHALLFCSASELIFALPGCCKPWPSRMSGRAHFSLSPLSLRSSPFSLLSLIIYIYTPPPSPPSQAKPSPEDSTLSEAQARKLSCRGCHCKYASTFAEAQTISQ